MSSDNFAPTSEYWASTDSETCHRQARDRIKRYYDYLISFNLMHMWRASHRQYYLSNITGGRVQQTGDQGELRFINVNHYTNILQHLHSIITQSRPEWDPKAINTDAKSLQQCKLMRGILDYYMRVERVERTFADALTFALQYGHGGVVAEWNEDAGKVVGKIAEGSEVKTGNLKFTALTPDDLIIDVESFRSRVHTWTITRQLVSRYELAEKYPHQRDALMSAGGMRAEYYIANYDVIIRNHQDVCEVFNLYHDRTSACPNGRKMVFTDNVWLEDGPLELSRNPVFHLFPQQVSGAAWGWTVGFDLLQIQDLINSLYSTIASNQTAFGVTRILVPNGQQINVEEISKGLALVGYDPALPKPEPMQLLNTPAEIGRFIQMLVRDMETLSGVNSMQRGFPDASIKSGSFAVAVQTMAIQFQNQLQGAYVGLIEDVGTMAVELLKKHAKAPMLAVIAGKSNRSEVRVFTSDDIGMVDRVLVDIGTAASRNIQQRIQTIDMLGKMGMLKNADQVITLLDTGRVEPAYEGESAQLLLIRDENEKILEGNVPPVLPTDDHRRHIVGHDVVTNTVDSRADGNVVSAALQHRQMHIDAWKTTDPQLLQLLGQAPYVTAPPPPQPAHPGGPSMEAPPVGESPVPGISMPTMPSNPLTGERGPTVGA